VLLWSPPDSAAVITTRQCCCDHHHHHHHHHQAVLLWSPPGSAAVITTRQGRCFFPICGSCVHWRLADCIPKLLNNNPFVPHIWMMMAMDIQVAYDSIIFPGLFEQPFEYQEVLTNLPRGCTISVVPFRQWARPVSVHTWVQAFTSILQDWALPNFLFPLRFQFFLCYTQNRKRTSIRKYLLLSKALLAEGTGSDAPQRHIQRCNLTLPYWQRVQVLLICLLMFASGSKRVGPSYHTRSLHPNKTHALWLAAWQL